MFATVSASSSEFPGIFGETRRPPDLPKYDHDDLGGCFFRVKQQIDALLGDSGRLLGRIGIAEQFLVAHQPARADPNLDAPARLLVELGAREAINLDGGGSAALVHRGHLLNRPYASQDRPSRRAVATAVVFDST